ncbi:MAG TPA: hypothetical protein VGX27_09445 [Candidatus Dormibacteraeota bacterium]|nr:hypothetical protein [Candidatus Dormibacteraeota bacterium]
MAHKPRWQRVAGAGLTVLGVVVAFATAAAGAPFWVVFGALLLSWLGIRLAGC